MTHMRKFYTVLVMWLASGLSGGGYLMSTVNADLHLSDVATLTLCSAVMGPAVWVLIGLHYAPDPIIIHHHRVSAEKG